MQDRYTLTPAQFREWLKAVGVTWAQGTVSQWINSGLIEAPVLPSGRPKDEARYSHQAIGEACALFAFFKSVGRHHPQEKTKLAMEVVRSQFLGPDWLDPYMLGMKAPRLKMRDPTHGLLSILYEMNRYFIAGDSATHTGVLWALCAFWKGLARFPLTEPREVTLLWTGTKQSKVHENKEAILRGALVMEADEDSLVIDLGADSTKLTTFFSLGFSALARVVPFPLSSNLITGEEGLSRLKAFFASGSMAEEFKLDEPMMGAQTQLPTHL